ncbi:MAG: LysR family transcriptional regulator [Hyphomicrobium sp.]
MARPETLPFDLRSLEIFLAVAESGAMAAAARTLSMTQPAVSQAIADLELKTGSKLFDRRVRPLGLTPPGAVLRQRASALLAEARQIAPLLLETERGRLALVRIGLVDSLGRAMSVRVARFLRQRAETVAVQSGLTAAHAGALLTRNLDLFIGVDDLVEVAGLERFELVREPYVLILPMDVAAPTSVAGLAELASRLDFIRYSGRSKTGIEIERHLRRMVLDIAHGSEFDTPLAVTEMVASGGGFAISTPLCLLESGFGPQAVQCVALPGPALARTLTLVARRQELGSLPRDLADACCQTLKETAIPHLERAWPSITGTVTPLR